MLEGAVQGKRGRERSIDSPQTGHTLTRPAASQVTTSRRAAPRASRESYLHIIADFEPGGRLHPLDDRVERAPAVMRRAERRRV